MFGKLAHPIFGRAYSTVGKVAHIDCSLPKGQLQVELKFENTPIRVLGNGLSLAGLMALSMMFFQAARTSRMKPC